MSLVGRLAGLPPDDLALLVARAQAEVERRDQLEELKAEAEDSLMAFIRLMWPVVEPARELVEGWVLEAIADHLEAVTNGDIRRLCINVFPGAMKSLLIDVFWPAWEWGPKRRPWLRYLSFSYSKDITQRDNDRFRDIIMSPLYRRLWGDVFARSRTTWRTKKYANDHTGWKIASSVGGTGTGERGDRVLIDDGNNVKTAESEAILLSTNNWFLRVVPSRLNDANGAIINLQQRTGEGDITSTIFENELPYEVLCIPMNYDPSRHCSTSIGWNDPRGMVEMDPYGDPLPDQWVNEGLLAWEERFSAESVDELASTLGPYIAAAQLQQQPTPKGGAIIKLEWWQDWPTPEMQAELERRHGVLDNPRPDVIIKPELPDLEYIVASLDTAFGEKEVNDFNALTIWGIWSSATAKRLAPPPPAQLGLMGVEDQVQIRLPEDQRSKVILLYAWARRLPLHGPDEERPSGLTDREWNSGRWLAQRQALWGLVEWVNHLCGKYEVDHLLVEDKNRGHDVAAELQRLFQDAPYTLELVLPAGDKTARANALVPLWSNGIIYAPKIYEQGTWGYPKYLNAAVEQFTAFPNVKHDDIADSGLHAVKHLRDLGRAQRRNEQDRDHRDLARYRPAAKALYDV